MNKRSKKITTMVWKDWYWTCECWAKYSSYMTWCSDGCGRDNRTDWKGNLIKK